MEGKKCVSGMDYAFPEDWHEECKEICVVDVFSVRKMEPIEEYRNTGVRFVDHTVEYPPETPGGLLVARVFTSMVEALNSHEQERLNNGGKPRLFHSLSIDLDEERCMVRLKLRLIEEGD